MYKINTTHQFEKGNLMYKINTTHQFEKSVGVSHQARLAADMETI